jgi:hypothetical protein
VNYLIYSVGHIDNNHEVVCIFRQLNRLPPCLHSFSFFVFKGNTSFVLTSLPLQTPFTWPVVQNSLLGCSLKRLRLFIHRRQSQLSATPDPNKVFVRLRSAKPPSLCAVTHYFFVWGVTAACVNARLLVAQAAGLSQFLRILR